MKILKISNLKVTEDETTELERRPSFFICPFKILLHFNIILFDTGFEIIFIQHKINHINDMLARIY